MKHSKSRLFGLFSISDLLAVSILLIVGLPFGQKMLTDTDTGWHIRSGNVIMATHHVQKADPFSFISPSLPWVSHEWLSEIVMYAIHHVFGLAGVVLFFTALITFIFIFLFQILKRQGGIFSAFLIFCLSLPIFSIHWLARPHVFSLLLLIAWREILDKYEKSGNARALWILLALMVLWVNLHAGFILGFLLVAIYGANSCIHYLLKPSERYLRKIQSYAGISIACIVASLLNPHGVKALIFPMRFLTNSTFMDHIREFWSVDFRVYPHAAVFLVSILVIFTFSRKRPSLLEGLLLVVFGTMAFRAVRNLPLFAIVLAPTLVIQLDALLNGLPERLKKITTSFSKRLEILEEKQTFYLFPILVFLTLCGFAYTGRSVYEFPSNQNPVKAVQFLKQENLPGHMFDNDSFGDYLVYAAWPQYSVFVDGRWGDVYRPEHLMEMLKVHEAQVGWESVIEKYQIEWVFDNTKSPICKLLYEKPDWQPIYADSVAAIFVQNKAKYQAWIQKYSATSRVFLKNFYKEPS